MSEALHRFNAEWWTGLQVMAWILLRDRQVVSNFAPEFGSVKSAKDFQALIKANRRKLSPPYGPTPYIEINRGMRAARRARGQTRIKEVIGDELRDAMRSGNIDWTHGTDGKSGTTNESAGLAIALTAEGDGLLAHPEAGTPAYHDKSLWRRNLRFRSRQVRQVWPPSWFVPFDEESGSHAGLCASIRWIEKVCLKTPAGAAFDAAAELLQQEMENPEGLAATGTRINTGSREDIEARHWRGLIFSEQSNVARIAIGTATHRGWTDIRVPKSRVHSIVERYSAVSLGARTTTRPIEVGDPSPAENRGAVATREAAVLRHAKIVEAGLALVGEGQGPDTYGWPKFCRVVRARLGIAESNPKNYSNDVIKYAVSPHLVRSAQEN